MHFVNKCQIVERIFVEIILIFRYYDVTPFSVL